MKEQIASNKRVWGFLRETSEAAKKAGVSTSTGLIRTGLNEYLSVIFPDIDDWVHDKIIGLVDGKICRKRPDYRNDKLKLIIEFDGLQHYTNPANILRDIENTRYYESIGYKVVRIPYFIQLTNRVVKQMFGMVVDEELFDEKYYSLDVSSRNTPAFLCYRGIQRMAKEFTQYPEQYKTNMDHLKTEKNQFLVDYEALEREYLQCKAEYDDLEDKNSNA